MNRRLKIILPVSLLAAAMPLVVRGQYVPFAYMRTPASGPASIRTISYSDSGAVLTNYASWTQTLATPTLAGSTVFVICTAGAYGGIPRTFTVVDSAGENYTATGSSVYDVNGVQNMQGFYFKNAVAGVTTVKCTVNTAINYQGVVAFELTGVSATASFGNSAANDQVGVGTAANAVTSTSANTTAAPGILVGLAFNTTGNHGYAPTAGSGYANGGAIWGFGSTGLATILSAPYRFAGNFAATATATGSGDDFLTLIAEFN